jgi:glycerophosphoryl diester phosphodiesterase
MPHRHFRPERIAHRGAPRELDENTVEGFLRAVERGADAVELDVHRTSDGAVVVHHDPTLAGPDGRPVPIAEATLAEVSRCSLARGGRVPTLAAVLDALGDRARVYVELKGVGVGPAAVDVAHEHGHDYAFHSFDHEAVRRLQARWPALAYGVLLDAGTEGAEALVDRYPVRDLWPHRSLVDQRLVEAAHAGGRRVIAWTVNEPDTVLRFTELGVDGLCTDDVRLLDPGG